jgi:hypothetical protein
MNTFILATGKTVQKDAKRCVAMKTRGRWHHKFFKSIDGAANEMASFRRYLRNPDMLAAYGLEECKLIKPEAE